MHRITAHPADGSTRALFNNRASRSIEQAALAATPPHTLMQRAGLAVARLALAVAPHAHTIWIACGPGNNGGDGLEAALHLHRWGKHVVATWLGDETHAPADALASLARARAAGVLLADTPPTDLDAHDLVIDALLGLGSKRAPSGRMAQWITQINAGPASVLAVDLPSGLNGDTGAIHFEASAAASTSGNQYIQAQHTLCLLTLKPGLFTGLGRDAAGQIWLDTLEVDTSTAPASALLNPAPAPRVRSHASHKGSYGDVAIVGGAPGMTGAALLAASAALHGGAGRVFAALLTPSPETSALNTSQPELMLRDVSDLALATLTVVCGCGGGAAVAEVLPRLLQNAPRLVLDADALNCVAADPGLQAQLQARRAASQATILTPHPLEAARLLGVTTAAVQADRLGAAQQLAERFECVVVLKGSGSVIATPQAQPFINPTGNARLATAGTGDVLAGLAGALLAAGRSPTEAACDAVFLHGLAADQWPPGQALTAGALARALSPPS
ncbi:NAD(P)H-hydrate dehydratase [Variovorax sp. HJSM1_2]|uniref:NAD(P)H-hydrate dehydratase n=1 Tax=Variovorax sp. HJSM1_2 TaxID=3366263 RepID=UPI003BE14868